MSQSVNIAVVGAGPYGLSIAAHLRAQGTDYAIFGRPLETWREHMPAGMLLKSDGFASNLSAPAPGGTLADYCAARGLPYHPTDIPAPLDTFIDYGLAFQHRFVPGLDKRAVTGVEAGPSGYRLELDDGETLDARRVVVAAGITHFDYVPAPLAGLPAELVSHASAHRDFAAFAGRDVSVLGAGASAVEIAVGLAAAGARPRLVVRRAAVKFASPPSAGPRGLASRIRHPSSGLGPGLRSRLCCDAPDLFRVLPGKARLEVVRRHLGPSSPWRLKAALEAGVEVLTGWLVASAEPTGEDLRLRLASATGAGDREVVTSQLICATGYRADVDRLAFLAPDIRARLRRLGGSPRLSMAFESSQPGLYFAGLAAAASFGPLMRFMHGDAFAARRISRHLAARRA